MRGAATRVGHPGFVLSYRAGTQIYGDLIVLRSLPSLFLHLIHSRNDACCLPLRIPLHLDQQVSISLQRFHKNVIAGFLSSRGLDRLIVYTSRSRNDVWNLQCFAVEVHLPRVSLVAVGMPREMHVGHHFGLAACVINIGQHLRAG